MTPKMENLKKCYKDGGRKAKHALYKYNSARDSQWLVFMRFSGECLQRHTTSNYYQCMYDAELNKQNVKFGRDNVMCIPDNCPLLRKT